MFPTFVKFSPPLATHGRTTYHENIMPRHTPATLPLLLAALLAHILPLCHCGVAMGQSFAFRHVGVESGLSHSRVSHLMLDSRGFVWASSQWGLDRYDGYELTPTPAPDTADVVSCHELGSDSVLVKTSRGFLVFCRSDMAFSRADSLFGVFGVGGGVDDAWVDSHQNIWARMGRTIGVARMGERHCHTFELPSDGTSVACVCNTRYGIAIMLSDGRVLRCYAPSDGYMPTPIAIQTPLTNGCQQMKVDFDGNLWALSARGDSIWFRHQSGGQWRAVNEMDIWPAEPPADIVDMAVDSDGRLWMATSGHGVYIVDFPQGKTTNICRNAHNSNWLRSNQCSCVTTTQGGFVFIGYAYSGFSIYHPDAFVFGNVDVRPRHMTTSLTDINGFATDGLRSAYVATNDNGVLHIDLKTKATRQVAGPEVGIVDEVELGHDGTLWLSVKGRGVARLGKGGTVTPWNAPRPTGGHAHIAIGNDRTLWVADGTRLHAAKGGDHGNVETLDMSELIVRMCREQGTSDMLVLTRSELLRCHADSGGIRTDRLLAGTLAEMHPSDLEQDSHGVVWIAAPRGVVALTANDDGTYAVAGQADIRAPQSLTADKEHNVVVTTSTEVHTLRSIRTTDGLDIMDERQRRPFPMAEGVARPYATCLMPDGDIWIGTERGIVTFKPYKWNRSNEEGENNVTFCSLRANGAEVAPWEQINGIVPLHKSLPYSDSFQLPTSGAEFTLHFAALGRSASPVVYVCDIEGSGRPTTYTSRPYLPLNGLHEGSYRLRVRLQDTRGRISDDGDTIEIKVHTPWQESVYAKGVAIIATLVMSVLFTYIAMGYRNADRMRRMARSQGEAGDNASVVSELRKDALVDIASGLSASVAPLVQSIADTTQWKGMPPEESLKAAMLHDRSTAISGMMAQMLRQFDTPCPKRATPVQVDLCATLRQVCESMDELSKGLVTIGFESPMTSHVVCTDPSMLRFVVVDILSDAMVSAQGLGNVCVVAERDKYQHSRSSITISMSGVQPVGSRYFCQKPNPREAVSGRLRLLCADIMSHDAGNGVSYVIVQIPPLG